MPSPVFRVLAFGSAIPFNITSPYLSAYAARMTSIFRWLIARAGSGGAATTPAFGRPSMGLPVPRWLFVGARSTGGSVRKISLGFAIGGWGTSFARAASSAVRWLCEAYPRRRSGSLFRREHSGGEWGGEGEVGGRFHWNGYGHAAPPTDNSGSGTSKRLLGGAIGAREEYRLIGIEAPIFDVPMVLAGVYCDRASYSATIVSDCIFYHDNRMLHRTDLLIQPLLRSSH